jgi:hypothetical protein
LVKKGNIEQGIPKIGKPDIYVFNSGSGFDLFNYFPGEHEVIAKEERYVRRFR